MTLSSGEVTHLLRAMEGGDRKAASRLIPLGCAELRRLVARSMWQERLGHPLHAAALAQQRCLRLVEQRDAGGQSRARFLGLAAQLTRRIPLTKPGHT